MRSGQLAALARDLLDLADALGLERFAVAGHDWGARAAYIAACVAGPQRISHCVALSVGWGTNDPDQALPLQQVQNYWYHWYMTLDRGARLVHDHRHDLVGHIWTIWNPGWQVGAEAFDAISAACDNPDWAAVTLHSYRARWGLAEGDPAYAAIEARVAGDPLIGVPTLVLHGGDDPCNDPGSSEGRERFFTDRYRRLVVPGTGHFPQRQDPAFVGGEIVAFLGDG